MFPLNDVYLCVSLSSLSELSDKDSEHMQKVSPQYEFSCGSLNL